MSPDPARAFLDACAEIEKHLKRRYNLDPKATLGAVLGKTRGRDALVRRYWDELRAFTDLRNALSHDSYQQGKPIATPLPTTVAAITKIRDEFTKPTTVDAKVTKGSVFKVDLDDQLRPPLAEMLHRSYSQAPVFENGACVGALTTNAVARWVAANMDPQTGDVVLEGATVRDVLQFTEPHEQSKFVKRDLTVAEAVETLLAVSPPLGLVVTHSGSESEKPLGILVAEDLPDLMATLDLSLK